jgi:hypothetical protein
MSEKLAIEETDYTIISPANLEALTRAIPAKVLKNNREKLPAGIINIDATFRIQGQLNVAEDYKRTPTSKIGIFPLLTHVLDQFGITSQETIAEAVKEAAQKILNGYETPNSKKLQAIVEKVQKDFAVDLPKVVVKGPIKAHLEVKEVTNTK